MHLTYRNGEEAFFSSFFFPLSAPIQLEPGFYLQLIRTKSNCRGCLFSGTEGIRRRWSSHTQTAPNSHYVTAVNAQLLWIYSMCSQHGKPLMYPFGFMSLLCDLLWNVGSGFLTSPMKNTFRCHGILHFTDVKMRLQISFLCLSSDWKLRNYCHL